MKNRRKGIRKLEEHSKQYKMNKKVLGRQTREHGREEIIQEMILKCSIYTVDYYSALKRNEIVPLAET